MRLFMPAVAAALSMMSGGCVYTNATVLDHSATRAPISPRDVVIYRTATAVPNNYDEVALLNSRGDSLITGERGMVQDMREEAARVGANGIILDSMSEPNETVQVAARLLGTSTNRRGGAIAIYVHTAGSPLRPDRAVVAFAPEPQPFTVAPQTQIVVVQPPAPQVSALLGNDSSRLPATPTPSAARQTPQRTICSIDPQTGATYNCRAVR